MLVVPASRLPGSRALRRVRRRHPAGVQGSGGSSAAGRSQIIEIAVGLAEAR
ncbi:MAG: hypothetical protein V9E94_07805 [Microthrixaceae bacterium]